MALGTLPNILKKVITVCMSPVQVFFDMAVGHEPKALIGLYTDSAQATPSPNTETASTVEY